MKIRNHNRRGRFALSTDVLLGATEEELDIMFRGLTIYMASPDIFSRTVIYDATSPAFREIEPHEESPWYRLVTAGEGADLEVTVHEATEAIMVHRPPFRYGMGVVHIPAGTILVDAVTGEDILVGQEAPPVIKLPGGRVAFHTGTPEQAAREQALVNARHRFVMAYMAEKGWGDDVQALTMDQLMEIRDQDGWKSPDLGEEVARG